MEPKPGHARAGAQGTLGGPPLGRLIITLDGPAGTGKSSTSRELARRLGLDFLDTGAMYRAAAAIVLDAGVDPSDHRAVVAAVAAADLRIDWARPVPEVYAAAQVPPRELGPRLRQPDVTALVSPLAGIGELRKLMVEMQQAIGRAHPRLVTEGRDQGSVVFPDAAVKFYLDAAPRVRAARRADEMRAAGLQADEDQLLTQILSRDESDRGRADGPLICPRDAIVVDTSALTFTQVVDLLEAEVRAHVHSAGLREPTR